MANRDQFEALPSQAYYPPQFQGNIPPGGYPISAPPPSGVGDAQKLQLYPRQDQPAVVIPPGTYGAPLSQQQAVLFVPIAPVQNPPQDHLGYSIFVTFCCCWIVGLFAIIRSVECRSAVAAGDRTMAERKSGEARRLAHIALGLGIVVNLVLVGIIFISNSGVKF